MADQQRFTEHRFVYGFIFRVFHWLVAACFLVTLALIVSRNFVEDAGLDKQIVGYHRSLGLIMLLLAITRITWRLFSRDLPYTGTSPLIQFVASISHACIYLLLISTPFLGWMESSARNKPIFLFSYKVPMLIERNFELAEQLQSWHINLAYLFCAIISIHILSAIWHHFIRKDGVLYAMLPLPSLRRPWANRLQANIQKQDQSH